ncbi:MAG TPA: nucleotidyltransferase domain-containing protein [Nocardioidaceae bacterium]|jgi:hypothetical protein
MDWSEPAAAVVPSLDGAVLDVLASTTRPLTGRDVARLARRGSPAGVSNVLNRMVDQGLVTVSSAGMSNLYTLNHDHVATPAVLALQDLRGEAFARIRKAMNSWDPPPVAAAVFGSAARGDGGVDSDVDLLVIRPADTRDDDPNWSGQVDALAQSVRRWTGNAASIIQLTPAEMTDMLDRKERIVQELRKVKVALTVTDVLDLGAEEFE